MTDFGTATVIQKLRLIITIQKHRVIKRTKESKHQQKQKFLTGGEKRKLKENKQHQGH